jgi:drug/metabolite transporter (DMT)-like permease
VNAEDHVPPMAAVAVAVAAVSTSAILIRWSGAPSLVKALYRVVFTTALLLPVAATRYRGAFARLRRRDAAVAAASGVALALHFAAWFESLEHTTVAASVTLVQAQPLFVAAGAWAVLGERVGRRVLAGVLVAVAGMAVMSLGDALAGLAAVALGRATGPVFAGVAGSGALYGNGLAVLGAVAMAGYVLVGRSLRQRVALVPYVVVVYAACAVGLFAMTVGAGHALTGYPASEWVLFLAMAVGPGVFGHTVLNWALGHVESSVVSVSLLGEPVGSTLLALLLLSEVPGAATLAGGAVVLGGIYLAATGREETDAAAEAPAEAA